MERKLDRGASLVRRKLLPLVFTGIVVGLYIDGYMRYQGRCQSVYMQLMGYDHVSIEINIGMDALRRTVLIFKLKDVVALK